MSLCDCDLDPVDCYVETKVKKSRKDHKCDDCYGQISKGSGYIRIGYVFDGTGSTAKRCGDCQTVRCMINDIGDDCRCLPITGIYYDLQNYVSDYGQGKLAAIIGAYNAAAKERGGKLIQIPTPTP